MRAGPARPRVVVAPDKFKGSLTATEVAAALAAGIAAVTADAEVLLRPVADGGDGTVDAAVSVGFDRVEVEAVGPTGSPVTASYALSGRRAVVELAAVVGLSRLPGGILEPMRSSTYGLGLVVRDALRRGADEVVLGLGGSASTDGGAGLAQALGARLLDRSGAELDRGGGALRDIGSVDLSGLRETIGQGRFVVACDVDNPLVGPRGTAGVFAPQKGAQPADVEALDAGLHRWAEAVAAATGADHAADPGSGAAGGTGFAAIALLGAETRRGIDLVLELTDFSSALAGADLVVTGEGSLDEQTLGGKAPMGVAVAARAHGVPVVAVAGRCLLSTPQLDAAGISAVYPLSDLEPNVERSMERAADLLAHVGGRIAADWLA